MRRAESIGLATPRDAWDGPQGVRAFVPRFLTDTDNPWLQSLLLERARFAGQSRGTWRARVREGLPVQAPVEKLRVALAVLDRLAKDRVEQSIPPRDLRAMVFPRAAFASEPRAVLCEIAAQLGLTTDAVERGLFADLPAERVLAQLEPMPSCVDFALLCNERIVRQFLQRALRVRIALRGYARAIVRHAKWTGLLCIVLAGEREQDVTLEISGPYSLFRHTRLYANALASLVAMLAGCTSYRLEADCAFGSQELRRVTIRSGDPICPMRVLPSYDSGVEEQFAREFAEVAKEWDLVREPRPIALGHTLFFPDFQLRRRTTGEWYWLEIIGYWTPEYIAKKLGKLERARLSRLVLCVDEDRRCSMERFQRLGSVVQYRRKIDVRDVLSIIDPGLYASLSAESQPKPRSTLTRC